MAEARTIKTILAMVMIFILCIPAAVAFGVEDEDVEYADTSKYDGKRIGVVSGNIYNKKAYELFKDPKLYYYKSTPDGVTALKAGKIDAFLEDEPGVAYYTSMDENVLCETIDAEPNYMAFMADKTERGAQIVSEFNEYLDELEESGQLEKLRYKWFKGSEEDRTIEDYTDLPATNGEIIIGTSPDYPPFEYMKGDTITGYEIELIMGFCRERGYRLDLRNVEWDGVLAGVNAGKFELGVSGFTVTEERKEKVLFTDPVLECRPGIAVMKDGNAGGFVGFAAIKKGLAKTFIKEARWEAFASGVFVTLKITVLSIILGTLLGFLIHLICRKGNRLAVRISEIARWLVQGMPEVVFLMIMYYIVFGRSSIGGGTVAIIVFTIVFACTMHDMLESGENGLDPGQKVAARALGYGEMKSFMRIILPQIARGFLPAYLTAVSTHIKATAVVGYIAVVDITKVGDLIRGATYEAFYPLISVAILYFIMAGILRTLIKVSTRGLNPENRTREAILKGAVITG